MINLPILDASNTVVSVVVVDPKNSWQPDDGMTIGQPGGKIGDTWDGTQYVSPPPAPAPKLSREELTKQVRAECEFRINMALGSPTVQSSMLREVGYLNSLVGAGTALSETQKADVVMLSAVNEWETGMIAKRESMIASGDQDFASDTKWPPAPVGLAAFLTGF